MTRNKSKTRSAAAVWAACLAAGAVSGPTTLADEARVDIGFLACGVGQGSVQGGGTMPPEGRELLCTFTPTASRPEETYVATFQSLSANGELLITHLRLYPEAVMKGLATIAETTRRFVEACLDTGIDGVFYAIQHAQASLLNLEEYHTFGLLHDLTALEPARGVWCNLLHLHGHDIYFALLDSLKFPIVNWHDRETYPSLSKAQELIDGVVCGGMRQDTLVYRDHTAVVQEAADALHETGGKRFILGTGCVVPVIASHGNILAARKSVE